MCGAEDMTTSERTGSFHSNEEWHDNEKIVDLEKQVNNDKIKSELLRQDTPLSLTDHTIPTERSGSFIGEEDDTTSQHSQKKGEDEKNDTASNDALDISQTQIWITKKLRLIQAELNEGSHWFIQCTTILLSAFMTYSFIHNGQQVHDQIAIMTVIILFGSVHPQLITAAGCGAFVGGQSIIPNYGWLALFSVITGLYWCFVITRFNLLEGFGGRLGTTTFLGMNTMMVLFLGPTGTVPREQYGSLSSLWANVLSLVPSLLFVASVVWVAWVGAACRKYAVLPVNPILIPVCVALASMLVVNATEIEYFGHMYTGFAVGSYVAMASFKRLKSLVEFALVGLVAGGWGLALTPWFVGFGGKAGFTAMLGHITYAGVCYVRKTLQCST